jgi:hypothetical protein
MPNTLTQWLSGYWMSGACSLLATSTKSFYINLNTEMLYPCPSIDPSRPARWTPFDLPRYLKKREGKVWTDYDTSRILDRAKQVDDLVERLLNELSLFAQNHHH